MRGARNVSRYAYNLRLMETSLYNPNLEFNLHSVTLHAVCRAELVLAFQFKF